MWSFSRKICIPRESNKQTYTDRPFPISMRETDCIYKGRKEMRLNKFYFFISSQTVLKKIFGN